MSARCGCGCRGRPTDLATATRYGNVSRSPTSASGWCSNAPGILGQKNRLDHRPQLITVITPEPTIESNRSWPNRAYTFSRHASTATPAPPRSLAPPPARPRIGPSGGCRHGQLMRRWVPPATGAGERLAQAPSISWVRRPSRPNQDATTERRGPVASSPSPHLQARRSRCPDQSPRAA
jgi:hypothetical protein